MSEMEVREVKLGDIITYNKGYAFKSNEYANKGKMVVRVTDFTLDSISDNDAVYVAPEDKYRKFIINTGDILIQTVGSWANNPNSIVGKVVRVPAKCDNTYLNQNIVRIIPNKDFNNTYLYYSLKANNFSLYCVLRGQGAANQASITLDTIFRFKFRAHSFSEQKRIADILSAYDKLIENNNKRIKLLEQMAENLYKEWFVRFRFPGYENTEFEEKKPRGWKVGTEDKNRFAPTIFKYDEFGTIGSFVRGKNITAAQMIEGNIPVISAGLQPSGYHNEANVFGENLTISASGANAGYLQYNLNDIWAADCSYYQNDATIWFVYNTLKYLQPVISNLQCGAAQPHVYPKNINRLCVLIPTEELIHKYNDSVKPYYDEIKVLNQHNQLLTQQRDLLLPRLMSGKLEV